MIGVVFVAVCLLVAERLHQNNDRKIALDVAVSISRLEFQAVSYLEKLSRDPVEDALWKIATTLQALEAYVPHAVFPSTHEPENKKSETTPLRKQCVDSQISCEK